MKLVFELRKEKINSNGLIPIQLVVRAGGTRIRRNTGQAVLEKHWDGSRVRPNLKSESKNNYLTINDDLKDIEEKVNDIFLFFTANKIEFTKEIFLSKFESPEEIKVQVFDFFECFQEFLDSGKLTRAANTKKNQKTAFNYLKKFAEEKNLKLEFESIDDRFFEELSIYSFFCKEIRNNYFAKIVAVLKTFLRWSIKKGYSSSRYFEEFKAPEHDIDIVYLTFEELMALYNYPFENRRLEHVRDFYCLGCFTSLRFSDLSKMYLANITEKHIVASIQKTKTQNHTIPLNDYSKAILEKYKNTIYEPIPTISSQKLNDYIKECCEIVGIDQSFTMHWFVGAEKRTLTLPKFKFITSHTARKTFITNSLLLGMEPKAIKKIANIKKDAVLDKYMKITEEFVDNQMSKAWNK